MPWVIDGSNVGGVLARGREGTRDRMAVWRQVFAWAAGRRRVVLVFDGAPADEPIPAHSGRVEVRYAVGISADAAILRAISPRARDWHVVTDDRALAAQAREAGARVHGAFEWLAASARPTGEDGAVRGKSGSGGPVDVDDWLDWFERHR